MRSAGFAETDNYSGSKSEWVALANAYVDLGTWWCVTPFVGAGIGMSRNTISGFRDDGVIINGGPPTASPRPLADDASNGILPGRCMRVLPTRSRQGFTVELAYRYVNLGDGVTGPTNSFDGVTVVNGSGFVMKDITSQDVKLGVRWELMSPPVYAPPPLVTKG